MQSELQCLVFLSKNLECLLYFALCLSLIEIKINKLKHPSIPVVD